MKFFNKPLSVVPDGGFYVCLDGVWIFVNVFWVDVRDLYVVVVYKVGSWEGFSIEVSC